MREKKSWVVMIGGVLLGLSGYTIYKLHQTPKNSPKSYQSQPHPSKLVACLGDSHTQGTMSYNFVNDLSHSMKEAGYEFMNAGINGDLTYNLLHRLDEVIACQPDYIIILIGTNDILAQLNKVNEIKFHLKKHLPIKPNEAWFISNLTAIISKLKSKTSAKIAILSLPLISQDPHSVAFQKSVEYSQLIQDIAKQQSITYLPLNESQLRFLGQLPNHRHQKVRTSSFGFFISGFKHYVLRKSWEEISQEVGLVLTVDSIHQNQVAGWMIESLICSFLESENEI